MPLVGSDMGEYDSVVMGYLDSFDDVEIISDPVNGDGLFEEENFEASSGGGSHFLCEEDDVLCEDSSGANYGTCGKISLHTPCMVGGESSEVGLEDFDLDR